jgi:hypothetical protein
MTTPTSFEMERILAYRLEVKLVEDLALQRQDIDLMLQDGSTVSVKMQNAAGRTGNISLEVEQVCTGTGEKAPGNFTSCKAKYIIIVVPEGGSRFAAHIWEHSTLAKLAAQGGYRKTSLTYERLMANQARGNKYDDAINVLVPLADARKYSRGVHRFDYAQVESDPGFKKFMHLNPVPKHLREF